MRERELDLREAELGETRKLREENRRMRSEELRRRGQEYENRCWEQHMKLQRELGREQAKSFGIMGGSNRCHRCDNYTCTCH